MTAAALETLARALARLEPKVFTVYGSDAFGYMLFATVDSNVNRPMICSSKDSTIKDDALFGAVWRCAVAQNMKPAVDWEDWQDGEKSGGHVLAVLYGTHEWGTKNNAHARAPTPGIALALAFCAARGDELGLAEENAT